MDTDEMMYHATPQTQGRIAHDSVDSKSASNRSEDIISLPVYSEEYRLMGKIDIYKGKEKKLIERKFQLKQIYQGQIYQLWAQMLCMKEMGYSVETLAFYETSKNRMIPIEMPNDLELIKFKNFINRFHNYNPLETSITINPNKCLHCIYCNLCDKTTEDNVYS